VVISKIGGHPENFYSPISNSEQLAHLLCELLGEKLERQEIFLQLGVAAT
jgi:hypothetical protein